MLDIQTSYKREFKNHLYFAKEFSYNDLSILTNKTFPFTTKFLNELIEEGIEVETGYANSIGGRRPQMYSLKPDLIYIVSVATDQIIYPYWSLATKSEVSKLHEKS